MNKKLGLPLALLVLLVGGYFGVSSLKKSPLGEAMTKGSISALLAAGKNVSCTMSGPDGSKGTVYVAGERVRGEFTTKGPNGTDMATSYIVDQDYMYMWSGKEGTKFKNEKITPPPQRERQENESAPTTGQGPDLDTEGDLDCKSWRPDNSMFTPPSDVKFTDFTAMMEKAAEQGEKMMKEAGTGAGISASVCDQVEDAAAKAQCVSALGGGN